MAAILPPSTVRRLTQAAILRPSLYDSPTRIWARWQCHKFTVHCRHNQPGFFNGPSPHVRCGCPQFSVLPDCLWGDIWLLSKCLAKRAYVRIIFQVSHGRIDILTMRNSVPSVSSGHNGPGLGPFQSLVARISEAIQFFGPLLTAYTIQNVSPETKVKVLLSLRPHRSSCAMLKYSCAIFFGFQRPT